MMKSSAAQRAASLLTSMALSYGKKGMDNSALFHQKIANELLIEDRQRKRLERRFKRLDAAQEKDK